VSHPAVGDVGVVWPRLQHATSNALARSFSTTAWVALPVLTVALPVMTEARQAWALIP
jgi:hypothetical protein